MTKSRLNRTYLSRGLALLIRLCPPLLLTYVQKSIKFVLVQFILTKSKPSEILETGILKTPTEMNL